jgi:hypothetical protein
MDRTDAVSAKRKVVRPKRRVFTRKHANQALTLVRRILQDAVEGYRNILVLQRRLQRLARKGKGTQLEAAQHDYQCAADRLNGYIEELKQVGCELKDFELGAVDFPAVDRGREICLSWQLGETEVSHFHHKSESFLNRRPLPAAFK